MSQLHQTTLLNKLISYKTVKIINISGNICITHVLPWSRPTPDWWLIWSRHNSGLLLCDLFCIARPALTSTDYGYQGRWWGTDQRSGHWTPGLTSRQWGRAHTDTRHDRARMPAGWIFTYLSPGQQLLTTHSFSVLTNTETEVAWLKLICVWIHVFV